MFPRVLLAHVSPVMLVCSYEFAAVRTVAEIAGDPSVAESFLEEPLQRLRARWTADDVVQVLVALGVEKKASGGESETATVEDFKMVEYGVQNMVG